MNFSSNLIPAPMWRPTTRTRTIRDGTRQEVIYHAIRGEHTLCGLTAWTLAWLPQDINNTQSPRCARCAAVGDSATHNDLMRLDLTYRQIDYWCRQGWLRPDNPDCGSGSRRTFPPTEAQVAMRMGILVAAGVTPAAAARAARDDGWLAPGVQVRFDERSSELSLVAPVNHSGSRTSR